MFCSHYWRRREPPVSLSHGEYFSSFSIKVIFLLLFYTERKFFTGKTNGFFTFGHFPYVNFPLLATTGAASVAQSRRVFLEFFHQSHFFVTVLYGAEIFRWKNKRFFFFTFLYFSSKTTRILIKSATWLAKNRRKATIYKVFAFENAQNTRFTPVFHCFFVFFLKNDKDSHQKCYF